MSRHKRKAITVLTALGLTFGLLFATGGTPAFANTDREHYLIGATGWCSTITGQNPGEAIVLGACANAASQQWAIVGVNGNQFEVASQDSGLCWTYNYPNGHADGGKMVQGYCVNAQTQIFEFYTYAPGEYMYWMPYRTDNNGHQIAYDDANYVLKPYNPIDGSYFCETCGQQQWSELYT